MIRRLVILDFLTFAPALFFASVGEILQWIAITGGVGLLVVILSISQVRSLLRTVTERNSMPNMQALPAVLVPGLAGLLLILPGLLSDLMAGVVLLAVLVSLVRGTAFRKRQQNGKSRPGTSKNRKTKSNKVIVVDYETVDEENTDDKNKHD